jgi:hypothetical protein
LSNEEGNRIEIKNLEGDRTNKNGLLSLETEVKFIMALPSVDRLGRLILKNVIF